MTPAPLKPANRFLDGCHKYGWVLNIIITALMFAYYLGGSHSDMIGMQRSIDGINQRMENLESRVNDLMMKEIR